MTRAVNGFEDMEEKSTEEVFSALNHFEAKMEACSDVALRLKFLVLYLRTLTCFNEKNLEKVESLCAEAQKLIQELVGRPSSPDKRSLFYGGLTRAMQTSKSP